MTKRDPFSQYHPLVCFLYFVIVIAMGAMVRHPAYVGAACLMAGGYYFLLRGRAVFALLLRLLPLLLLVTLLNPLFNSRGETILISVFGRPFTLEALCYGGVTAGIFALTFLWFGCYNVVLTGDKFTALFGNLIPSLSLLLVMVLRMIGEQTRKLRQILNARSGIGKGITEQNTRKETLRHGMIALSALTDRALEGSVVTGDSMKARGYGSGKRTSFAKRAMGWGDVILLVSIVGLGTAVLLLGNYWAEFDRAIYVAPLGWGFVLYCGLLFLPILLHIKEVILWHRLRFEI